MMNTMFVIFSAAAVSVGQTHKMSRIKSMRRFSAFIDMCVSRDWTLELRLAAAFCTKFQWKILLYFSSNIFSIVYFTVAQSPLSVSHAQMVLSSFIEGNALGWFDFYRGFHRIQTEIINQFISVICWTICSLTSLS